MKKLFFTFGLFFGLTGLSQAQHSVNIKITADVCIDEFTIHYKGGATEDQALGCTGKYTFNTGEKLADAIIINGVICYAGSTEVTLSNGKTVKLESIQDESKGFSSLIR